MKHGNVFFMQVSRGIRDDKHKDLSIGARALFLELNELEQRFCSDNKTLFYRTDEQLAQDMGVSLGSLKKYKKELKEKASDLVLIQKCQSSLPPLLPL